MPVGRALRRTTVFVHAAAVGSGIDAASGQPKVGVTLRVLDEKNQPVVAKPFTGSIDKDVPANSTSLPIRFYVPLNRPGNYTIELDSHGRSTERYASGNSRATRSWFMLTSNPSVARSVGRGRCAWPSACGALSSVRGCNANAEKTSAPAGMGGLPCRRMLLTNSWCGAAEPACGRPPLTTVQIFLIRDGVDKPWRFTKDKDALSP